MNQNRMRAYKFLDAKYGLESIEKRRLKQSRVSDLNDPFELRSFNVTNVALRKTFQQTAEDVHKCRGLLCFSSGWNNPVIWAHYSDKHRGLCLGFRNGVLQLLCATEVRFQRPSPLAVNIGMPWLE